MNDKLARTLAATAVGIALVALVLGVYAVSLGLQYKADVQTLGTTIQNLARAAPSKTVEVPMRPPRPTLDPDDR